jgi:hypothetical protein
MRAIIRLLTPVGFTGGILKYRERDVDVYMISIIILITRGLQALGECGYRQNTQVNVF